MTGSTGSFLSKPGTLRILVRGVNWLGDAVMTTPALVRLREACPSARITMLCQSKMTELWQGHPAVDEIIPIGAGEGAWAVSRRLRAGRFDAAVILPNSPRSALEVWLAGIPARAGYARPWRNWLLTTAVKAVEGRPRMRKRTPAEIRELLSVGRDSNGAFGIDGSAHQIYDYLHLVGALGASRELVDPVLRVSPSEMVAARGKFLTGLTPAFADSGSAFVGLNPGAEYGPAKRWPLESYVEVARVILNRDPAIRILVFGGGRDVETASAIVSAVGSRALSLAGRTTLREMMSMMSICRVLVTNDTGPMHVAAALGVPVVAIFGSTSPELTSPGSPGRFPGRLVRAGVACSPCFLRECPVDFRCMKQIPPSQVLEALTSILVAAP